MLGKILYISDNIALIEYKASSEINGDLLNIHLVFENENQNQKILGEITEIKDDQVEVKLLGEFVDNRYVNGLLRKPNLNCKIRTINATELQEIIGINSKKNFPLGKSAIYNQFVVYPSINDLFANHFCIFGNTGSGKSCGTARIVQNILSNRESFAFNANLIFFDSFGEYKNAFRSINNINQYYQYKFISTKIVDEGDEMINIPLNLMTVDDYAVLLQAEKHSQITIIGRAINYAKIFSVDTPESISYKNNIIAKALLTVLYSNNTIKEKKDEIFRIIDTCNTKEFNFDSVIPGLGYSRSFSECFAIDSHGNFGEEVLITEYILKYIDENMTYEIPSDAIYTLEGLAKALEFTLISDGFNQNKIMHDDAQIIKVRLNNIINSNIRQIFTGDRFVSKSEYITNLLSSNSKKAQIINISLEDLDDSYAKSIVKIFAKIIFDFAKSNTNRATIPFHIFLEEAHRYVQNDNDVFLLGYNIFDRIAKEGRKYGVLLGIITQRPSDMSDTVISQCSNFLIFKMTHPKDIGYITEMLPNISQDVIDKMKSLQPGTCVAFGAAFKIPMICKLEMPNPQPFSSSCDVSNFWDSQNTTPGGSFSLGDDPVKSPSNEQNAESVITNSITNEHGEFDPLAAM